MVEVNQDQSASAENVQQDQQPIDVITDAVIENAQLPAVRKSRQEVMREADPDMDAFGVMNLFTDSNYKEITYEYGEYRQTLQALDTASTDYDLTG